MAIERRKPVKPGRQRKSGRRRKQYWFEKIMAAIALLNFALVLFDYSYIRFRDLYLRYLPTIELPGDNEFNLTVWYGETFKGIEPNRATEAYLDKVDELEQALADYGLPDLDQISADIVVDSSLPEVTSATEAPENFSDLNVSDLNFSDPNAADTTAEESDDDATATGAAEGQAEEAAIVLVLLAELRTLSADMIDENPFEIANKSGTLERIKERMRDRLDIESATEAFQTFWSQPYLEEAGWLDELEFFRSEIQPLIETNYYRGIGLDGNPADYFIIIDSWFIIIFAVELVLRSLYISRRYAGTNLVDAVLWRWYDLFLILPFWRLARIVPVVVRINQSNLLDLSFISDRARRGFVTYFAIELTEIVILRTIEQVQNLLRQGDIFEKFLEESQDERYIDLNGVNEIETITQRLIHVTVYQVLPKIRPELEAVMTHSVLSALQSAPAYASVARLPGMNTLPQQLAHELCKAILDNLYGGITSALEDREGAKLTEQLVNRFSNEFRTELTTGETLPEIQELLVVLLDEVKINYVQNLADEDLETLREETQQLYQLTQEQRKLM